MITWVKIWKPSLNYTQLAERSVLFSAFSWIAQLTLFFFKASWISTVCSLRLNRCHVVLTETISYYSLYNKLPCWLEPSIRVFFQGSAIHCISICVSICVVMKHDGMQQSRWPRTTGPKKERRYKMLRKKKTVLSPQWLPLLAWRTISNVSLDVNDGILMTGSLHMSFSPVSLFFFPAAPPKAVPLRG